MDNIHKKHRERMYEKLKRCGTDAFNDHELLEMILYNSIPRKDTNPLAHSLINKFGGLENIFKASQQALTSVEGIGEKSAALIFTIGEIGRRNLIQQKIPKNFKITSSKHAMDYCETLFLDERYECFYAICLDVSGKILSDGFICEGVVNQVPAYSRKIVEAAVNNGAHTVIIAHNHPGGDCYPSKSDDEVTVQAQKALAAIGINLNDHIIVGDNGCFSYLDANFLKNDGVSRDLEAAQKINMLRNE